MIFLVDESGSIEDADFIRMKNFINDVVTALDDNPNLRNPRFALTTFNAEVDTHVILGEPESINGDAFKNVVTNTDHGKGLTCTSGGLRATFRANFGSLDFDGRVLPRDTNLREGVPAVIFLITDGVPTTSPNPDSPNPLYNCNAPDGDCQCTTAQNNLVIPSSGIYAEIKMADTADWPNKVVALGVGPNADSVFLESVSDTYLETTSFDEVALDAMVTEVTSALLLCNAGTPRPSKSPIVEPTGLQPCEISKDCGPDLGGGFTRGKLCRQELKVDICIEGFCLANNCDDPLDFCGEDSCVGGLAI